MTKVTLKRYSEYKQSELPWVGEMPSHWNTRRAKWLFTRMDRPMSPEHEVVTCFRDGTVTLRRNRRTTGFTNSLKEIGYQGVKRDDLVIHAMDAFAGAIGVSDSDGKCTPVYLICQPRPNVNPHYYALVLREMARSQFIVALARGIRERSTDFRFETFGSQLLPLPPYDEQNQITSFVSNFKHQAEALIRNKQRIIKLLDEQKQAVVYRAVTRGLDPNTRLRPSGIDWLGVIPEHWHTGALRLFYSVQLGKMLDTKRISGQSLMPYIRNIDVQWDSINTIDLPLMDIRIDEYERYTVQPGDLMVCEGGDVGRSAFWKGELDLCGYQKALHRVRPLDPKKSVPRFLFYVMYTTSKLGVFQAGGSENTIAHLTSQKLRAHRFAFPPRDEQEAIADYLDIATSEINSSANRIQREIELIREYCTRLIANVVIGQLDVREIKVLMNELENVEAFSTIEALDVEEVDDSSWHETEELAYADD